MVPGQILPALGPDWALFLDVDGTLVEIAAAPDAVRVAAPLVALLGKLHAALGGALALVSGRSIETLDRLFSPLRLPAAGNHGLERRAAGGRIARPARQPAIDDARTAFDAFARRHPGVIVEDKALSVALHFRNAPQQGEAAERLAQAVAAASGGALTIQPGKMMVELRPPGADKGSAIADFMREAPFAGRVPAFIGDDVTDETGFAVVNALGGHSIRIGRVESTTAHCRIDDVSSLRRWLRDAAATIDGMRLKAGDR